MIYTLTLNPAIDRLLFLDTFKKNITNRLSSADDSLGGKGTHVSMNLKALGLDNTALGICHGDSGEKIIRMLREAGITTEFIHKPKANSRTNYILVEKNGDCSTLSEKGVPLSQADIDELIVFMKAKLHDGDILILSGDASNCSDPAVYNYILNRLSDLSLRVILDASGSTLKECLSASPWLIKPNQDELSQITGREIRTEEEIIQAVDLLKPYHIPMIAVSLGGDGSLFCMEDGSVFKAVPPKVDVYNTIGCGDCYLSGLICGILSDMDTKQMLRLATAVSAATAESRYSVGFDPVRAKELENAVTIQKIR